MAKEIKDRALQLAQGVLDALNDAEAEPEQALAALEISRIIIVSGEQAKVSEVRKGKK